MGILSLLLFSIVLISSWHDFSSATATLNTTIEDQTTCEMCSSCESPCQQPVVSPPPPPPPVTGADCPPLPSHPPPAESSYHPPPHGGDCSHCPPPNPIVQYIPFYYYKPNSNSLQLNSHSFIISSLIIFFSSLLFLWTSSIHEIMDTLILSLASITGYYFSSSLPFLRLIFRLLYAKASWFAWTNDFGERRREMNAFINKLHLQKLLLARVTLFD